MVSTLNIFVVHLSGFRFALEFSAF